MKSLFLDTNIAVDLLAKREPFYSASAPIFAMGDRGMVQLFICSLSFSTIFYLLRSFRKLVRVLPVNDDIVDKALQSSFTDFEDAIQYYSAVESGIDTIITRNVKDFRNANASVMTPEEYLNSCH